MKSFLHSDLKHTKFCVLDFETTGLSPDYGDRAVEIALVRYSYDSGVGETFSSLINPCRTIPWDASNVHGICDDDVLNAPTFPQILRNIAELMDGTVIVGHNVYFDLKFLLSELRYCGINLTVPHICTMSFAGFLGGKTRKRLIEACYEHGISHQSAHCALDDTIATTNLFSNYLAMCFERNILTFQHLKDTGKKYKFISSWKAPVKFGEIPTSFSLGTPIIRNNNKKALGNRIVSF